MQALNKQNLTVINFQTNNSQCFQCEITSNYKFGFDKPTWKVNPVQNGIRIYWMFFNSAKKPDFTFAYEWYLGSNLENVCLKWLLNELSFAFCYNHT